MEWQVYSLLQLQDIYICMYVCIMPEVITCPCRQTGPMASPLPLLSQCMVIAGY